MNKTCKNCRAVKSSDDFYKNKTYASGVSNTCKVCHYQQCKLNREKNPEKYKAHKDNWIKKNPEWAKFVTSRAHWKRRYGITPEQYDVLKLKQNNQCAICLSPPEGCRLSVDHCHKTGRIRGLLCRQCNAVLGLLKEDPSLFFRAADYLKT